MVKVVVKESDGRYVGLGGPGVSQIEGTLDDANIFKPQRQFKGVWAAASSGFMCRNADAGCDVTGLTEDQLRLNSPPIYVEIEFSTQTTAGEKVSSGLYNGRPIPLQIL